jgi:hypothetical protein
MNECQFGWTVTGWMNDSLLDGWMVVRRLGRWLYD